MEKNALELFIDWIASFPIWFQMFLIVGVLFFVCLFLYNLSKKEIKIKDFIEIYDDDNDKKEEKPKKKRKTTTKKATARK